jgi:glycosyltransferase involved in cell wall biosynthesis
MLSLIIPASNEAGYIGACLQAVFASPPIGAEVIVVANGCHDATAEVARGFAAQAQAAGWGLRVLELTQGGKPNALNQGDTLARHPIRVYLDADVVVSPELLGQLSKALSVEAPRYVAATPRIPPARSAITRAYARFWQKLPFAQSNAGGYGLFSVNATGRARWGAFPEIISDDTFVRLQFLPEERLQVPATYEWPMIEGFAALTRVRRRQNLGTAEIARLYPDLMEREAKPPLGFARLARLMLADPLGFATYAFVSLAVKGRKTQGWVRGR